MAAPVAANQPPTSLRAFLVAAPVGAAAAPRPAPSPALPPAGVHRAATATGKGLALLGHALWHTFTHPVEAVEGFVQESADPFIHPVATLKGLGDAFRENPMEGLTQSVQVGSGMVTTGALLVGLGAVVAAPFTAGASLALLGPVATALTVSGFASMGASGVSLAKHEVDASGARDQAAMSLDESRIADDVFNLAVSVATIKASQRVSNAATVGQGLMQAEKDLIVRQVGNVDRYVGGAGLRHGAGHSVLRSANRAAGQGLGVTAVRESRKPAVDGNPGN